MYGIGGFLVADSFAAQMEPLVSGGTGSFSHLETMRHTGWNMNTVYRYAAACIVHRKHTVHRELTLREPYGLVLAGIILWKKLNTPQER